MSKSDQLRSLERLVAEGAIGRREFLSRAAALGVAAGLAPGLVVRGAQAAPRRGGFFRAGIGAGSTTDSLDPATFTDSYTQFMAFGGLRNCLTEVDHTGKLVPELAESWESTPDAAQWTFKLRRGVEFHNGKTMDAEDVVASINHHRGEKSKSAAKGIVDPIAEIRADGKDTVVFRLKGGNADFPYIMSDYHLGIMPATADGVDWKSGVGTGGYTLVSFEPGVTTRLKRNPNYWKPNRAFFDEAEVLSIKDVAARTNALTTGEIHAMDRCDLKTVHLLKRNRGVEVVEVTGTQHYTVPMITTQAPFNDNNVRLALKHAVDREAMLSTILRGHGIVGNDHPIAPANRFYAADLPQRQYDPDKARFYLKKAGLKTLKVDLSAADAAFQGAVDAAVLYKEHAAKAGIEINVVRESNDGYWSNVWMKKPWCMCYWGGRPTEDWMFSTAYAADAPWNDTYWKHERFNELLKAARAELDESKRREMYHEMQRIVRDEGGVVVMVFANYVSALADKVEYEAPLGSNWDMDGMKGLERWWFA